MWVQAATWMNFEDIKLSERSQTKRLQIIWFHLWQMTRTGRSIKTESRFTAARDWDGTLGRKRGDCCWIWDLFWAELGLPWWRDKAGDIDSIPGPRDPTCLRATGPRSTTTAPTLQSPLAAITEVHASGVCAPWQEKPPHEKPTHHSYRVACASNGEDPGTPYIDK